MRDPAKLRAFELADQLVILVYGVTKRFPRDERFGLTSQLRRAAVSVASNIVEGCSRKSQDDYRRFLEIAYGSAQEVRYQLGLSRRLGFLTVDDPKPIEVLADETCRVLNVLIVSLR